MRKGKWAQNHPKEKGKQGGKVVIWGRFVNSWRERRSEKQKRKVNIHQTKCRVPKNAGRDKAFFNEQSLKERKTTEGERLAISSGKLEISWEHFAQRWAQIKGQKRRDVEEAEDIKKRWEEYMQELHKIDLSEPDNHNSVVSHPVPDILECEVRWALESTAVSKASGYNRIPVELFNTL